MYDLPSAHGARKVVIDEAVVNGETPPYVIYESEETTPLRTMPEERLAAGSGSS